MARMWEVKTVQEILVGKYELKRMLAKRKVETK
jgi:hypothetical protein